MTEQQTIAPSAKQNLPAGSFIAMPDGHHLFQRRWELPNARAQLLLCHGIGEHSGRYCEIAPQFNTLGLDVIAYDHYGHGQSDGARGTLDISERLDCDLAYLLAVLRAQTPLPVIVFGHSMGGAVAANRIAQGESNADLLILSSPALRPRAGTAAKLAASVMAAIAPDLVIRHGLSLQVSHRPDICVELKNDPLCHKCISGRLGKFIQDAGERARKTAPHWPLPTLLLYAGQDFLVDANASRLFAAQAPNLVQSQEFADCYHEIFHETDPRPVYQRLEKWLDAVMPPIAE